MQASRKTYEITQENIIKNSIGNTHLYGNVQTSTKSYWNYLEPDKVVLEAPVCYPCARYMNYPVCL